MPSSGLSLLRRDPPALRRPRSILGAVAVATGVAVILGRRRAAQAGVLPTDGGSPEGERQWTCPCGQEYRVQGVDRHRVYWLAGADASDPVLESECPKCGETLPREHEHPESVPG